MHKNLIICFKEYILLFLTATILLLLLNSKSFSQDNVFMVNNIKVSGKIDINFTREKYINIAFENSFKVLMSKILTSSDMNKIGDVSLTNIKNLINSFQILNEKYKRNKYEANFKIFYNDKKIKKLLIDKNISFSQPKNISAILFPVLFINNNIKNFEENFFYKNWNKLTINYKLIDFILPLEDLEDLDKINKMKDSMENLDLTNIANKYDSNNYAFLFMYYNNKKLNVHIKTNFEGNKIDKNILYKIDNINDQNTLNLILTELKMQIIDIWKQSNVVNLLMPLSIKLKFKHANVLDLENLKKNLYKISIIDKYKMEELSINHSYFKIYYYGNPKRLKSEFSKHGYILSDDQGYWELFRNG